MRPNTNCRLLMPTFDRRLNGRRSPTIRKMRENGVTSQWAEMTRMMASKPMKVTRGKKKKKKVSGPRKPNE